MKERITLDDNLMSALIKVAEGNPGAITAMMTLADASPKIDPDSVWKNFTPLLDMDGMGIYGSNIWILWKDVCEQDPVKFSTLTRARQLGIIRESLVVSAAQDGRHSFDFGDLLAKVRAQLPKFARETENVEEELAAAV